MSPDVDTREDRVVAKAIDGSAIHLIEIQDLARIIAVDREDIGTSGRSAYPNLLNDGVIRRDLLKTGVAEVIVEKHWDLLQNNFAEKLEKIRRYRGYEHPDASFLSAKAVWERFAPEINREWSKLSDHKELDAEAFGHLSRLYLLQNKMPAEWMRRILSMHQQQYAWLRPDPRLQEDDLSMFGFHTLSDWFGKDFVDLTAQFIHNAAIEAENKGYTVTKEEAKADLRRNFFAAIEKLKQANYPLQLTYPEQLRILGMSESQAAAAWRKVLLMRRYFNDIGEAAFVDRLPYAEFAAIASEKAKVDVYEWPQELHFSSSLDLFTFETYLKEVSTADSHNPLALPETFASVADVAKRAPELVCTEYTANVAVVDKRETSLNAPLKEVWEYETQDDVWKTLTQEYAFVRHGVHSPEERFQTLETLNPAQRGQVDLYARRKLLDRHPEWIHAALNKAEAKEYKLILSAGKIEMPHVENPARLGALFEQIPTQPESALSELQQFHSGEAVFCFSNIAKQSDQKIKTFAQAKQDGSLSWLVDRALQSNFEQLKSKLPESKSGADWSQVKEELAELMLSDLKKQILKTAPNKEVPFHALRLLVPTELALKNLQSEEGKPLILNESELNSQFALKCTEKEVSRTTREDWMSQESLIAMPKNWSPIHVASDGAISFLYIKEKIEAQGPVLEQLSIGKEMLVSDVQQILAEALCEKMTFTIPIQPEQE